MDNLESMTYEVFEQDPVKYIQYEEVRYFNFVTTNYNIFILYCIIYL